jgi:hypothetical protein
LKELYILSYRGCRIDAALYHPESGQSDGGTEKAVVEEESLVKA